MYAMAGMLAGWSKETGSLLTNTRLVQEATCSRNGGFHLWNVLSYCLTFSGDMNASSNHIQVPSTQGNVIDMDRVRTALAGKISVSCSSLLHSIPQNSREPEVIRTRVRRIWRMIKSHHVCASFCQRLSVPCSSVNCPCTRLVRLGVFSRTNSAPTSSDQTTQN
jgi:hypothetical protein